MMRRRDREEERPERERDREEYESRRHGFEESPRDAPSDDERRQIQSAMFLSAEKQHARQQLEALNMRSAASAVLGVDTVKQLLCGGEVPDPLQDRLQKKGEGDMYDRIAQAFFDFRYTGKNAGDPKKLVMKNNQINEKRLSEEYDQIVVKGPESIRWAKAHGKLNLANSNRAGIEPATCSRSGRLLKRAFPGCSHPMGPHQAPSRPADVAGSIRTRAVDPRLLDEVTNRPNLPDAVKDRVKVLLREMAERIQAGASDDEDDEDE